MSHFNGNKDILPCVLGGVAVGFFTALGLSQVWSKEKTNKPPTVGPCDTSGLWDDEQGFSHPPDTPAGFTMRDKGFNTFLEKWLPGDYEPPHSHPGDDATIVIEGTMEIQFYTKSPSSGELSKDGEVVTLSAGQTGFIEANRIHDARYKTKCKLVYVHNKTFDFKDER
mmetsp:Transcript_29511/g.58802  ORF Transcript_29511/g.58802 Transcript_29511/m.58802 type:complete len:168 (+) Transcript_29511:881-1384(+)